MRKRLFVSVILGIVVAACATMQSARDVVAPPALAPAPTAPTPDPSAPEPATPSVPLPAVPAPAAATPDAPVLPSDPSGAPVQPADATAPAAPAPASMEHVDVRGVYMTGYAAGTPYFYELVDYMVRAGLNAIVIDVKDDTGTVSWPMDIPLVQEIGAGVSKIRDIEERVRYLKERGIYPIARIVCYADPLLGSKRPDLAIQNGKFVDGRGIRWPDPYNEQVWEYNLALAREAARVGFREVQFDYIRFPEFRIPGYNYNVPVEQRTAAIEEFLRRAVAELHPLGVFVSADVFGLTTSVAPGDDMEIGQDYAAIAEIVDYIKPMIYPSHYNPYTYGVADPNSQPGKIVYESMVRAQQRTWDLPVTKHRPWIQDFDMGKKYTAADIEAQIRGLAEAGIYQWILWDPHNRYTRDANYDVVKPTDQEPAWKVAYRAERAARAQAEAEARAKEEAETRRLAPQATRAEPVTAVES